MRYYYNNEIKRLAYNNEYKELLSEYFEISELEDFFNERYTESLFEFVDVLNYRLSWNMLGQQNLIFNQEQTLKLLEGSLNQFG